MRWKLALLALALLATPVLADDPKAGAADKKDAKKDEKPKEKLYSPDFDDAPLADLLSWLTREAGLEYDLTKAAEKLCKRGEEKVRVIAKDKTAREVLDLALAQLGLSWAEKTAGQIKIMTADEYAKDAVLELYDVRELLADVHDFPGPDSSLVKKGENGSSANTGRSDGAPGGHKFEEPPDDQKEKDRPKKPMEEPEKLKDLVRQGTGGDDAWGEGTSMDLVNGILYVKAPWSLQVKVRTILNQFRQFK